MILIQYICIDVKEVTGEKSLLQQAHTRKHQLYFCSLASRTAQQNT